jgi:Kef-type K+ transport system membrane component KefB/nucleotide-binding universal stress UspA family protein
MTFVRDVLWRSPSSFALPRLGVFGALGVAAIICLAAMPVLAAEGGAKTGSESLLIAQIVVLIFTGRLLAEGMVRLGQPAVMGELLAGILLGPSIFGTLWPEGQAALFPDTPVQKAMINAVAQFGILMLLLLAGMETEIGLIRKVRKAAASASLGGIALPFLCGFLLGEMLPDALLPDPNQRLITSLFLGTALSISSVKIVASVIREMGFMRRDIGQIILASAIVDDTIGWIIIAVTLSLAAHGTLDWLSIAQSVFGTLLFLGLSFTVGRKLVFRLIRLANDHLRSEAPVIAVILVIMGTFAWITHAIGVHTVLGAFVAGILIGESPILTRQIDEQLRGLTAGLFMPVFFGLAGLSTDMRILSDPTLALMTLGLVLIASFGKASGAFAGGWFGGLTKKESTALAFGMNARGSTEVIVATIGLSMGVLTQDLFTMIVAMAFITTMAMPPTLRWALARLPMQPGEKKRLDREILEARGFVTGLERVLVAADASATGRFAARIAGLLAGSRGMPVTVLKSKPDNGQPDSSSAVEAEDHKQTVATAAAGAKPAKDDTAVPAEPLDVIDRLYPATIAEAVAEESSKGYDLLVIGIDPTVDSDGNFTDTISRIAQAFDGSIAVVVARGVHAADPAAAPNILMPLTGSQVSRQGAEVAMALAKAAGARMKALVISTDNSVTRRSRFGQARRDEEEVVKEIKTLARSYGQRIKTETRTDLPADAAIRRGAKLGQHNLVVLGASRRPGDVLSFGNLARALLESGDSSLLIVAPQAGNRFAPPIEAPALGGDAKIKPDVLPDHKVAATVSDS